MSRIEDALNKAEVTPQGGAPSAVPAAVVKQRRRGFSLDQIHTNLEFALVDSQHPVILFVSTVRAEGTTSLLYQMADLLASERKVLLVDMNFSHPDLHNYFSLPNTRGVSDVFLGKNTLPECVSKTSVPNLEVLPTGPVSSGASQILASKQVKELLSKAKASYDCVLVDGSPLRVSPDTALLGGNCDGVVLVVRSRKTKREVIRFGQEMLEKAGAKQLGVILNRVKFWIPSFLYRWL